MYDHPHLRYLNNSQKGRLETLSQDVHDGNPTSKHDFFYLQHLSIVVKSNFDCHDFSASLPLMSILLLSLK